MKNLILNENGIYESVRLSVLRLWTRKFSIELSDWIKLWHTLSKYPTKIVKIRAFVVLLKKYKIAILISDNARKSLLIIFGAFF